MEAWKQSSGGSLRAAKILFREGEYQSCVSRTYYAAYCAATEEIIKKMSTFPNGWNNPPHAISVCLDKEPTREWEYFEALSEV